MGKNRQWAGRMDLISAGSSLEPRGFLKESSVNSQRFPLHTVWTEVRTNDQTHLWSHCGEGEVAQTQNKFAIAHAPPRDVEPGAVGAVGGGREKLRRSLERLSM